MVNKIWRDTLTDALCNIKFGWMQINGNHDKGLEFHLWEGKSILQREEKYCLTDFCYAEINKIPVTNCPFDKVVLLVTLFWLSVVCVMLGYFLCGGTSAFSEYYFYESTLWVQLPIKINRAQFHRAACKQTMLLNKFMLSRNAQDTSHKLNIWNGSLAGNLIMLSIIMQCLAAFCA